MFVNAWEMPHWLWKYIPYCGNRSLVKIHFLSNVHLFLDAMLQNLQNKNCFLTQTSISSVFHIAVKSYERKRTAPLGAKKMDPLLINFQRISRKFRSFSFFQINFREIDRPLKSPKKIKFLKKVTLLVLKLVCIFSIHLTNREN